MDSVYPRVGISLSASETDDGFYLSETIGRMANTGTFIKHNTTSTYEHSAVQTFIFYVCNYAVIYFIVILQNAPSYGLLHSKHFTQDCNHNS